MEEKNENRKSKKGLIIFLVVIVVLLLGVIGFLLYRTMSPAQASVQPTAPVETAPQLTLDKSQGEYKERETAPPDDSGVDPQVSVTLPGWGELHIPANTTKIDRGIDFYNPKRNMGYYYLTFQLNIDKDGDGEFETNLYQSGLVEPTMHIQEIEISEPLAPGTYSAQVFLQPYRMDEALTPTNNGAVNIPLIVEE